MSLNCLLSFVGRFGMRFVRSPMILLARFIKFKLIRFMLSFIKPFWGFGLKSRYSRHCLISIREHDWICLQLTLTPDRQQLLENSWTSPHLNHFRLDVDVGFDSISNKYSVQIVIRDDQGRLCGDKACIIRNPGSVVCGVLLAIKYDMDFCLRFGLTNVCIFSDCLR